MAPEQASGRHREVGPPTDVHGLGVTLYEILTGKPPYRAATPLETLRRVIDDDPVMPRVLRADLPRDLDAIIRRCLEKAPGHRYPTAGALADDLRRYLDGRPVLARPDGPVDRLRRWTLRPERVRDAGLALTCLGLINVLLNALCWAGYLAGVLRPARPAAFVRDLLIALLVHDLPVFWFGLRTLRGSRWGLRLGLGVSCYFLGGLVWSVLRGPYYDFGGLFGDAQGRLPFEVMLIIFVGGTTALAALALPADRARRAARGP
jgi:hypothetical protein